MTRRPTRRPVSTMWSHYLISTSFWHPDGTPMSAQQFMEMLFGKLPEFFKNEAELRALWSDPSTWNHSWVIRRFLNRRW